MTFKEGSAENPSLHAQHLPVPLVILAPCHRMPELRLDQGRLLSPTKRNRLVRVYPSSKEKRCD